MKYRSLINLSTVSLLAVASLSAQKVVAPAAAPKPGAIPRAADGHPDLKGSWSNATLTPFERPDDFAGKATISDAEARDWVARDAHRCPISSEGGAYNTLVGRPSGCRWLQPASARPR